MPHSQEYGSEPSIEHEYSAPNSTLIFMVCRRGLPSSEPRLVMRSEHRAAAPSSLCPRQDSNLRTSLRRRVLYPLSYGGSGLSSA
jgi:hypothetical protein